MALPPQSEFLRPILEIADRATEALSSQEILRKLTPALGLSQDDLQERIPSGALRVDKHVRWSVYQLKGAGWLVSPPGSRGRYRITDEGRQQLGHRADAPRAAELNMLAARRIRSPADAELHPPNTDCPSAVVGDVSPDEQIEVSYEQLRARLADELLESMKNVAPARFEELVVELLVKMGYGSGRRVGRSGDGGIDGVLNQDRLGLEKVYVQAKRWNAGTIGEREIRNFSGSLDPHGATKGVFITTSRFSESAKRTAAEVARNNKTILLIDGPKLANLMIEYGVGVVTKIVYEIKEIDENYFADGSNLPNTA